MADLSQFAKAYYVLYEGDIRTALNNIGLNNLIILNNRNALLYTPVDITDELILSVSEIKLLRPSLAMGDLGIITNNINEGVRPSDGIGDTGLVQSSYLNLSGSGVIIAIIDSGIDYTHPDFIKPNGTSKIIRIWDQENQNGTPPEGYLFGSEYTNEQINEAIKNNDLSLIMDTRGTGTMSAGLAAGLGSIDRENRGIAPGADLLVVKLREYPDPFMTGEFSYRNIDYLAAVDYAFKVATDLNRPLVVNGTVDIRGWTFGTRTALNALRFANKKGRVIVYGAGNEGNTDTHYSGRFTHKGEFQDILIEVGENQENLSIFLIAQRPDKISISIITPSGEISPKIDYREFYLYSGTFNIQDVDFTVFYYFPEFITGDLYASINLSRIKPGIWTIRLHADHIVSGIHDLFMPVTPLIDANTRFLKPDPFETITIFGSDSGVITIGSYDIKTSSIWIGSSNGAVPVDYIKPDIVASGVNVIGPFPGGIYNTLTGTGASSSIVSGVVALILEYFYVDGRSIESAYTQVIKTFLMVGATTKYAYTFPNVIEGYGELNIINTFRQISQSL